MIQMERRKQGGWCNPAELPKGPNGRNLCRWCQQEVPKGRITFCSDGCVHEWSLRTNPSYLRNATWKRDKGICKTCGRQCKRNGTGNADSWYADHIVEVREGGGQCGLENMQTLCHACHCAKTKEHHPANKQKLRQEVLPL